MRSIRSLIRLAPLLLLFGAAFPGSVNAQVLRERAPGQMKQLINNALEQDKRVSKLHAYVAKGTVVFDVTLEPNPDEYEWLVLLNLTPAQFAEAKRRYGLDGYTVTNSTSLTANGQVFHSAIWLKTVKTVGSLVLPDKPLPESGEVVANMKSVDDLLRAFVKANNASGVTVAVAKDGKVVYDRAFGWANVKKEVAMSPNTPMRIAGVSKTLTAVSIMQLIEQDKLALHTLVVPLLKKAKFRGSTRIKDQNWNKITVGHLLRHTAGFTPAPVFQTSMVALDLRLTKPATRKDIIRYHFRQKLGTEPGQKYVYSDFGYSLLGRVLETVTDRLYGPYVQEHILDPAKMEHTKIGRTLVASRARNEAWYHMQKEEIGAAFWSASVSKVGRGGKGVDAPDIVRKPDGGWNLESMDSHNGWISTPGDLVKFVSAMESKTNPLLKPETRTAMLESAKPPKGTYYACGWFVRPESNGNRIWHGGALEGTSSLLVRRSDGIAWAVLFNTDISNSGDKRLAGLLEPFLDQAISAIKW